MNTFPEILRRSNYSFIRALTPSRQLYESVYTGNLVIVDWRSGLILPLAA